MTSGYHGNQVYLCQAENAENAKKKVKNRHTWLTIPSKFVHQISKTNIHVYCTDFALYERIRKYKVCNPRE